MILIIRDNATPAQINEMLEMLQTYIKLAVDIEREILAGGGAMHADCEAVLLDDGSRQEFIWGADWDPSAQQVTFESLINIRPRQNNPSMDLLDPEIRKKVAEIVIKRLGDL
jgi:hypothetical protein